LGALKQAQQLQVGSEEGGIYYLISFKCNLRDRNLCWGTFQHRTKGQQLFFGPLTGTNYPACFILSNLQQLFIRNPYFSSRAKIPKDPPPKQ